MGFKKSKTEEAKKQRVLKLEVYLATPDNHTKAQDLKAIEDLNIFLQNITLEELAKLAAFVQDPDKKALALQYL